jgi:hypothetical protein
VASPSILYVAAEAIDPRGARRRIATVSAHSFPEALLGRRKMGGHAVCACLVLHAQLARISCDVISDRQESPTPVYARKKVNCDALVRLLLIIQSVEKPAAFY